MKDFEGRCAYCMRHVTLCDGDLEVDHFDPTKKDDSLQYYDNLFPASRGCNKFKSNRWPDADQLAAGERFLNPCAEMDYGGSIFEDPVSHLLVGTTSAARWHIDILRLNREDLVDERRRRSEIRALLSDPIVQELRGNAQAPGAAMAATLETVAKTLIPPIPPPPSNGGSQ